MFDPYAVLGVSPAATQAEITHAYRCHLRKQHPDMRAGKSNPGTDEPLRQLIASYTLLRDPTRRADYDRTAKSAHPNIDRAQITITRIDTHEQAPLWAGPVHWHVGGEADHG